MSEQLSPMDKMFDAINANGTQVAVGSMYPSPGDYHVTSQSVTPHLNAKTEKHSARVECLIDKGPKALIGKTFSFFLAMDNTQLGGNKTPLSYTADRLFKLFEGEYTKNGQSITTGHIRQYLDKLASGHTFVVRRTAKKIKNGSIMPNDALLSVSEYNEIEAASNEAPEEKPEVAAAVGDF